MHAPDLSRMSSQASSSFSRLASPTQSGPTIGISTGSAIRIFFLGKLRMVLAVRSFSKQITGRPNFRQLSVADKPAGPAPITMTLGRSGGKTPFMIWLTAARPWLMASLIRPAPVSEPTI